MNNTETMQMLADELNKTLKKHFPDYEWVLVDYPDMPEIEPQIRLVNKDGKPHENVNDFRDILTSREIKRTIYKVREMDTTTTYPRKTYLKYYKGLKLEETDKNSVGIVIVGDLTATPEDIEKIGAIYSREMEETFAPVAPLRKLADALNKIGESWHDGNKFAVRITYQEMAIKGEGDRRETAEKTAKRMQKAMESTECITDKLSYNRTSDWWDFRVSCYHNTSLNDEDIKTISSVYHQQLLRLRAKDLEEEALRAEEKKAPAPAAGIKLIPLEDCPRKPLRAEEKKAPTPTKEKTSLSTRIINKLIGKEHC